LSLTTFCFPTTIRFGVGVISHLAEELARLRIRRPLIVTDSGLAGSALFARVAQHMPGGQIFSRVEPNPTEGNVLEGMEQYRQHRCDGIV